MTGQARNLRLRLPHDLHRHLADSSKARGTSLNTEIVERLRYTFSDPSYQPADTIDLEDLLRRLGVLERAVFGEPQESDW